MKYLKSHIFLIFALVSILFSIEIYFIFTKIVHTYEQKIVKNYAVIVVSKTPIKNVKIENIYKIEPINIDKSLSIVKENLQNFDLSSLKKSLPYFYRFYFKTFPTPQQVKMLENRLKQTQNIIKIESFKISQTQIYNLLLIIKIIIGIFMVIIAFISFLLMIKQLEVWRLQHSQRMYIMELFGAPFLFRSAVLLKLAIFDSIISIFVIFAIIEYFISSNMYQSLLTQLGINVSLNIYYDLLIFLGIALFISLFATFIVILSRKDDVK